MADDIALDDITDLRKLATTLFRPSQPVRTRDFLVGRDRELDQTLRALEIPGRSVFIFGERGVGKTSLAQTAGYLANSSDKDLLCLSAEELSFGAMITKVVRALMPLRAHKVTYEARVGGTLASLMIRLEERPNDVLNPDTNDAVAMLKALAPQNKTFVVIVDEVDLAPQSLKQKIAHFLKQAADNDCPIKFIFAGIARDVHDLMDEHASSARYLSTVRLDPLGIGHLAEIATVGFNRLNIGIWEQLKLRIALLSDGFAYFTHLICLNLAWLAIDSDGTEITSDLFDRAIVGAVADSELWLRKQYEDAVQKYQDYEPVLWAAADHYLLLRPSAEMYESYLRICRDLGMAEPQLPSDSNGGDEEAGPELEDQEEDNEVSEDAPPQRALRKSYFQQRLYNLKGGRHGTALESERKGWYKFRVPMLRGYCRLMAEKRGIEIGLQYLDSRNKLCRLTPSRMPVD